MPCTDITDVVRIVLDENERVLDYSLHKRTCGRDVGQEKLIGDWLIGRQAADVIKIGPEQFKHEIGLHNEIKEYLALKHFLAVQGGLAVLFGHSSGGLEDYCTVDYINCGPEGIEIVAYLSVDALVENIEQCKVETELTGKKREKHC